MASRDRRHSLLARHALSRLAAPALSQRDLAWFCIARGKLSLFGGPRLLSLGINGLPRAHSRSRLDTSIARKSTCIATFRYNTRTALGYNDFMRAELAAPRSVGAKTDATLGIERTPMRTEDIYSSAVPMVVKLDIGMTEPEGVAVEITYAQTSERFEAGQFDRAMYVMTIPMANELLSILQTDCKERSEALSIAFFAGFFLVTLRGLLAVVLCCGGLFATTSTARSDGQNSFARVAACLLCANHERMHCNKGAHGHCGSAS